MIMAVVWAKEHQCGRDMVQRKVGTRYSDRKDRAKLVWDFEFNLSKTTTSET